MIVPANWVSCLFSSIQHKEHRMCVSGLPLCASYFILICTGSRQQTAMLGRNMTILSVLLDQGSFHFVCNSVRMPLLNSVGSKNPQTGSDLRESPERGLQTSVAHHKALKPPPSSSSPITEVCFRMALTPLVWTYTVHIDML